MRPWQFAKRINGARFGASGSRGLLAAIVSTFALVLAARAEVVTNHPLAGVICTMETRVDPPERLFIAEVDLTNPRVHLRVSKGGPDPDGPGRWQTTLMEPTRIGAREHFDVVVNGDFFLARGVKDGEGTNSKYLPDMWAAATGPAVTDGTAWSSATNDRPCLVVSRDRKVTIESRAHSLPGDWEVVAGNTMLVENGVMVPHAVKTRHPRTVAGLDASGTRLIILVVDGRKPGVSLGMSYAELSVEMLRLGCRQALNLDGGGSSVFAVRDSATGIFRILNRPSDGHERAVANALGISIAPE